MLNPKFIAAIGLASALITFIGWMYFDLDILLMVAPLIVSIAIVRIAKELSIKSAAISGVAGGILGGIVLEQLLELVVKKIIPVSDRTAIKLAAYFLQTNPNTLNQIMFFSTIFVVLMIIGGVAGVFVNKKFSGQVQQAAAPPAKTDGGKIKRRRKSRKAK